MRKSKIIKIDDLEVTLKALRVRDIYELFNDDDVSLMDRFNEILARCSDLDFDGLLDMTGDDLKNLMDGFLEVNAGFLELAAVLGLEELPQLIKNTLKEQFALSFQQVTVQ